MTKDIKMPQLSEDADSGTIVEILVQEGDEIEEEQSIVAVESDKASVEVPSPEAGTVQKISISEGDELSVGDVILTLEIGEKGEEKSDEEEEGESSEDTTSEKEETGEEEEKELKEKPKPEKEKQEDSEEEDDTATEKNSSKQEESEKSEKKEKSKESAEDVPAPPSVRRLSRELEVDIYQVEGSGPGGRITAEDVKAYAEQGSNGKSEKSQKQPTHTELPDFSQWGATEREKLSSIRRVTAESMTNAWQTIPHVTQFDQADVTELEQRQESYEKQAEKSGGKLTLTATLLKVSAAALRAFPKFNASIDLENEEVILKQYYHIGVAADTEQGLLVPVIRDVNKKSVVDLSVELPEIAQKARDGKLSSDEMQGGTFTISNLGGIGGTNFTPIVYHPQVAILGVSRTQVQPVYKDDGFEPRSILPLSLSYDHRLIDGAEAARFLRWICRALEDPMVALMEG